MAAFGAQGSGSWHHWRVCTALQEDGGEEEKRRSRKKRSVYVVTFCDLVTIYILRKFQDVWTNFRRLRWCVCGEKSESLCINQVLRKLTVESREFLGVKRPVPPLPLFSRRFSCVSSSTTSFADSNNTAVGTMNALLSTVCCVGCNARESLGQNSPPQLNNSTLSFTPDLAHR